MSDWLTVPKFARRSTPRRSLRYARELERAVVQGLIGAIGQPLGQASGPRPEAHVYPNTRRMAVALRGAAALALAGATVIALRPPYWAIRLAGWWRPDLLFHAALEEKVVALSFDDGPDPTTTPAILEVLKRHGAHATFFFLGSRADRWRLLLPVVLEAGHEVANHLWDDQRSFALSQVEFERQLMRTDQVLRPPAVRLFRPGGGFVSRKQARTAARHGYTCVLGSVYPCDAHVVPNRWIIRDVARRVRPGGIIILHEGHPSRIGIVDALDRLLRELRALGYRVVSVTELAESAKPQDSPSRR